MRTLKEATNIFNSTKGKIFVLSFASGFRYSTYGGLNIIQALNEISIHLAANRQVIITNEKGDKECLHWEFDNKKRCPYWEAYNYSLTLKDFIEENNSNS